MTMGVNFLAETEKVKKKILHLTPDQLRYFFDWFKI